MSGSADYLAKRLAKRRVVSACLVTLSVVLALTTLAQGAEAEPPLSLKVLNFEAFGGADLQSYMMHMKEVIRSRWHPSNEPTHATKIFFQIFGDGSLLQHSVEQSSGDKDYDAQANSIIEGCAPFGAPPPGSVRLMNIVATFGADTGNTADAGTASGAAGTSNNRVESTPTASDSSAQVSANEGSPGAGGTKSPLQGEASASGAQSSTSTGSRFLTGEASASGQYSSQPLQGQAIAQAPPVYPMYQAQAQMQAPPMFQAQTGMQAPFQVGAQQQQPAFYQAAVQHGQSTIGVLGCEFGLLNNQIRQIMPGSDLLRYGFAPGDIIEAADGQHLRGKAMQAYVRGQPGTYIQLTVLHQGRIVTVPVMRKDTREFANYNGYFRKWAANEKFW